ncbi:sugar ABC transporter permease [Marinactinospora endophytica]
MLLMIVFLLYPILSVFYYSLQHYNVTEPWNNGFAGLENYRTMLFEDPLFWRSLGFTAQWVGWEVILQLLFGLLLALIVNETFRWRGLARATVFAPWVVSGVLTTVLWTLLYSPTTGFLRFLSDLGIGSPGTAVLADPDTVFGAAVLAELWRGVPFFAILLLADLQTISKDLYEAASVDGAGRRRRFLHITLPHLKNAIILSTLLRAIWEFNNVDLLYTLTGGGPANATTTLPLYVAQQAVDSYEFGYGAALTTASFGLLLICSLVYLRLSRFGGDRA